MQLDDVSQGPVRKMDGKFPTNGMYEMNNISEIDLNDFYEVPVRMIERPFM